MNKLIRTLCLLFCLSLVGCGGGGGGGSNSTPAPSPEPTDPTPEPTELAVVDALPLSSSTNVHPGNRRISFAHFGQSDLATSVSGDCSALESSTIRRDLFDLATTEFDQLLDHKILCELDASTSYTLQADGTRSSDSNFRATHTLSTGTDAASGLVVLDQLSIPRDTVDELFTGYVAGALLTDLDLPSGVEALVLSTILNLAEANWDNLVDPNARYDVISERISYRSSSPDGAPDTTLTGLIVRPDVTTAESFIARDTALVLSHATGSTPSDLNPSDAWFILANQFAARGYLVIAADNYGRGGTADNPETYLLANRTADNSIDLIEQVLADPKYDGAYDGTALTIAGYSQGGHSAFGLWLALQAQGHANIVVDRVYAGGAPHNLYQTFRGVLQHLDSSCDDSNYCRFVDEDTTVAFATDRILPGLLAYTDAQQTLADIVEADTISPAFVSGFLATDATYDRIKALLQLNSFSNIDFAALSLQDPTPLIHLYHSDFDRLVPKQNTEELATALSTHLTVDYHESRCNGDGYELIFNLTDKVGVIHTLCGLSVLDDIMEELR
ncbi:MAG: putative esterase [Candidatus Azotimanducaceae bacterium]|jgi:predicted esterase